MLSFSIRRQHYLTVTVGFEEAACDFFFLPLAGWFAVHSNLQMTQSGAASTRFKSATDCDPKKTACECCHLFVSFRKMCRDMLKVNETVL